MDAPRTDGRCDHDMKPIPDELCSGPFLRERALALGLTSRMLDARRIKRIHPRVYCLRDYELTYDDRVRAAKMALPDHVRLTGISRIREAGLDYGPELPVRFVIEGDHHLAIEGIFLHRTKRLPPSDDVGVTMEAAFISYCSLARVIDAIKVGDWLIHRDQMDLEKLKTLALGEQWRDGADEALWISNYLNKDAASLKESEVGVLLVFAGLPVPEFNKSVDLGGMATAHGDLVYRKWGVIIEYEGRQHQEDRAQYNADIDRYALYREYGHRYIQVTNEHLGHSKNVVRRVHAAIVEGGYDGPEPRFGEQWRVLFARVRTVVGPRVRPRETA